MKTKQALKTKLAKAQAAYVRLCEEYGPGDFPEVQKAQDEMVRVKMLLWQLDT